MGWDGPSGMKLGRLNRIAGRSEDWVKKSGLVSFRVLGRAVLGLWFFFD